MIKKLISYIIVICMIFSSPTQAFASSTVKQQTEVAGKLIGNIMELIAENYYFDVTLEELYEGALLGMTSKLDEYSNYFSKNELLDFLTSMSGSMVGIGIIMEQRNDGVYIQKFSDPSPAKDAGILIGDKITKINNVDVTKKSVEDVHAVIGLTENVLKITVLRNNQELTFEITKTKIKFSSVANATFSQIYDNGNDKIGYVSIASVEENTASDFKQNINYFKEKNIEKIVLDLRNNPGGDFFEALDLCQMIVPAGPIVYTIDKNGFKEEYKSELKTVPFKQMVVLVNSNTASAAELIASALQDSGNIVVGETTYGKGLIQSLYELYLQDAMKITIKEYLRRNGEKVNKIGVIPDVPIVLPKYISSLEKINYKELKELLKFIGLNTGDGDNYDSVTVEAIKIFQSNSGLESNGIINDKTAIELNRSLHFSILNNDLALKASYDLLNK